MPNFDEHHKQAIHNYSFLNEFSNYGMQVNYTDWYVTAAFYTAVHLIEALIFSSSRLSYRERNAKALKRSTTIKHSEDAMEKYSTGSRHVARKYLVRDNPDYFHNIYDDYKNLEELSFTSRYTCQEINSTNVKDSSDYLKHIIGCFERRIDKKVTVTNSSSETESVNQRVSA